MISSKAPFLAASRGADFIFSTTGKTAISGWSRAKRRLDGLIEEGRGATFSEPWRLNDLRASFRAIMSDQPASDALVLDRCLGRVTGFVGALAREWMHAEAIIENHRRALERWAALVTGEPATGGPAREMRPAATAEAS